MVCTAMCAWCGVVNLADRFPLMTGSERTSRVKNCFPSYHKEYKQTSLECVCWNWDHKKEWGGRIISNLYSSDKPYNIDYFGPKGSDV